MESITTFVFPIVRRNFIFDALDSLHKHTPYPFSVVVVDQTLPDPDFEARLREQIQVHIKPDKNLGFAQAANVGMRIAPTPFVTVVNDDVVFIPNPYPKGWFSGVLETFDRHETAMAVNPYSPRDPGWAWGEEGYREYISFDECQDVANVQKLIDKWNGAVIDGITCWCTTFKREALEEVGYFDERCFPGGSEDYDWDARCYQAGYRALGTTLSWCWHWWGQSKDEPDGRATALPDARPAWNKISTKGFGDEGLWDPDLCVWGRDCTRTDPEVWRAPL